MSTPTDAARPAPAEAVATLRSAVTYLADGNVLSDDDRRKCMDALAVIAEQVCR